MEFVYGLLFWLYTGLLGLMTVSARYDNFIGEQISFNSPVPAGYVYTYFSRMILTDCGF